MNGFLKKKLKSFTSLSYPCFQKTKDISIWANSPDNYHYKLKKHKTRIHFNEDKNLTKELYSIDKYSGWGSININNYLRERLSNRIILAEILLP